MTMEDWYDIECGCCHESSEQDVLMSTNEMYGPDLDLRPGEDMRSTMNTWLQLCPYCGYCAMDISVTPADAGIYKSPAYQAALKAADYPKLARRFLAHAIANESSDPLAAAQSYLHTAWLCDDARKSAPAIESRRRAAELFILGEQSADNEQKLNNAVVLVDIYRRCGQFQEAETKCTAILAIQEVTGVMRDVLKYQQRLIEARDTNAHSIEDLDKAN